MKAGSRTSDIAMVVMVAVAIVLVVATLDPACAQGTLFGAPRRAPAPPLGPLGGIANWLLAKQSEFYRQFSSLIRAAKADSSAAHSLMGLSFLYGIFHAAGPGHGKAVISSYLLANEETWRRGLVLSLASALLQAVVAITVVGVAAVLLEATAATMKSAVDAVETVSYALIVVIGVRLLWMKGRAFVAALRIAKYGANGTGVVPAPHDHGRHDHCHHHADPKRAGQGCDHHHHDHDDALSCGHAHSPEPAQLGGPGGWKRGFSAILAVGLRPCSGAILVLVFALAQSLFWVGIGSALMMGLGTFITVAAIATIAVGAGAGARRLAAVSDNGFGTLAVRGAEFCAAALITVFGILLLCGYLIEERMMGF
jgi:nickel/cobalt exporter